MAADGDQLDLPGLIIPLEFGGSGCSHVELAVVMEQMGAALYCSPYLSTVVLATNLLLASDDRTAMARHLLYQPSTVIVSPVW